MLYFVEETLDYVHEHADEVRRIVADADAAGVVGDSLVLRAVPQRSAAPVDILMGATVEEVHPLTGRPLLLRSDTQYVEPMYEYGTFAATLRERVPQAYLIPAGLETILTRLAAHGIALEPAEATPLDVEAFRIDSVLTAERPFQGAQRAVAFRGATNRTESPRPPETCWCGPTSRWDACCSAWWSRSPTTASRTGGFLRTGCVPGNCIRFSVSRVANARSWAVASVFGP